MLIVISPAKTLDYTTPPVTPLHTVPELLAHSETLIQRLRGYSALELMELMEISRKLADLNLDRYHAWSLPFTPQNAKQAVLAMKGDVYTGLDAERFTPEDFSFAGRHLRILSGLYGVLRPLDLMQPYRLEMGTALPTERGRNLYEFWGEIITEKLNEALAEQGDDLLINLASTEYFKSVRPAALRGRIITPQFKERKGKSYRIVGILAKRARGMMSRYIIRNRLSDPEALKAFGQDDYRYDPALSSDTEWVFTRG